MRVLDLDFYGLPLQRFTANFLAAKQTREENWSQCYDCIISTATLKSSSKTFTDRQWCCT
jgi:hypothetical protein